METKYDNVEIYFDLYLMLIIHINCSLFLPKVYSWIVISVDLWWVCTIFCCCYFAINRSNYFFKTCSTVHIWQWNVFWWLVMMLGFLLIKATYCNENLYILLICFAQKLIITCFHSLGNSVNVHLYLVFHYYKFLLSLCVWGGERKRIK